MFNWLKKRLGGVEKPEVDNYAPDVEMSPSAMGTLHLVTVWDVVDQFLSQNPQPTPYSVHALIAAGAHNLLDTAELMQACDKIQEHGYQYPINGVLLANLDPSELLDFLRWQSTSAIEKGSYDNEANLSVLIEHFRAR
jgi:hypothetical protein